MGRKSTPQEAVAITLVRSPIGTPRSHRILQRGFTNIFKQEWTVVNLRDLNRLEGVQDVTPQVLVQAGLVRGRGAKIKVLAEGSLSRAVHVQAHRFSEAAIAKIQAAGGKVEV